MRHQLDIGCNQNGNINLSNQNFPWSANHRQPPLDDRQNFVTDSRWSAEVELAFVRMFPGKKVQASRNSLGKGLDSKILNYVREFNQVQLDSASGAKRPGVLQLYNLLQERDAQLRRVKKVQLEASIQRALGILQSEIVIDSDGESFDSDFEGIEDLNLIEVKVVSSFVLLTLGYECT